MRIVAGEFRGRRLKTPTWDGLRPTSDRLRETLFNILGDGVRGARVLDGYAGTGAIGLEALSRGAAAVTFVERDPRAVRLIEVNLASLGLRANIRSGFANLGAERFDLVVLDPPYAPEAAADALQAARALVVPGGRLVIEHAVRHAPPAGEEGARLQRTVKAGDSALSFYDI